MNKPARSLIFLFAQVALLLVVLMPAFGQTPRGSRSLVGEYICDSDPCTGITFNLERSKRGKYRLWRGDKGTSSDNYFSSDATKLLINDSTGSISFTYENGECSFKGVIKNRKMTGENICLEGGQRKTETYTLVKFR